MARNTPRFVVLSCIVWGIIVFALAGSADAVRFLSSGYHTRETIMTESLLAPRQPPEPYVDYDNQHFDFTAMVPQTWTLYEHYDEDRVFGHVVRYIFVGPPESVSGVGFTAIEFRFVPTVAMGGSIATLDAYVSETLVQKNRIDGSVVDQPADAPFLGLTGKETTIAYPTQRPVVGTVDNPPVDVTTIKKWICIERNGYFVEVSIHSSSNDIDLYQPVYDQAKNSMSFR